MKKAISLFLAVVMTVLLFAACKNTRPEDPVPSDAEKDAETEFLRQHFPRIDGSTSLIPFEAGIRAAVFGISMEEAEKQVKHSTTWGSFYNLMERSVDMIFSVPLSEQQENLADGNLAGTAVSKDGFVFVVNASNPVDGLTQQQLRDIYSGKITNWKEVGGNDVPIVAYQRNQDSGSQNFMVDFMRDTPLMDAPTELRPNSMGMLMDVIASPDYAENCIGYSVYAYAADMYRNQTDIKFLKIDGVMPGKASMASGEYPLTAYNYAYYFADEPEDGAVRRLVKFIVSDAGQLALAKAGYVTLRDIGYPYEDSFRAYTGIGTGAEAEERSPFYYISDTEIPWSYTADGVRTFLSDLRLKDKKTEAEIREFVDENEKKSFCLTVKNGILGITCGLLSESELSMRTCATDVACATWDLLTGKRLTVEELFCKGVKISSALTAYLRKLVKYPDSFGMYYEQIGEITGLPESGWMTDGFYLYFVNGLPYFQEAYVFPLNGLKEGILVADNMRDMHEISEDSTKIYRQFYVKENASDYFLWEGDSSESALFSYQLLKEGSVPGAAVINASIQAKLKNGFTREMVEAYFARIGKTLWQEPLGNAWELTVFGEKYVLLSGSSLRGTGDEEGELVVYPEKICALYRADTGEEIPLTALFRDGWEDVATVTDWEGNSAECPDLTRAEVFMVQFGNNVRFGFSVLTPDPDGTFADAPSMYLDIPEEYLDW